MMNLKIFTLTSLLFTFTERQALLLHIKQEVTVEKIIWFSSLGDIGAFTSR